MKRTEFDRMKTDDLWSLHIEVSQLLQERIQAEKLQLEERLKLLRASESRTSSLSAGPPQIPES